MLAVTVKFVVGIRLAIARQRRAWMLLMQPQRMFEQADPGSERSKLGGNAHWRSEDSILSITMAMMPATFTRQQASPSGSRRTRSCGLSRMEPGWNQMERRGIGSSFDTSWRMYDGVDARPDLRCAGIPHGHRRGCAVGAVGQAGTRSSPDRAPRIRRPAAVRYTQHATLPARLTDLLEPHVQTSLTATVVKRSTPVLLAAALGVAIGEPPPKEPPQPGVAASINCPPPPLRAIDVVVQPASRPGGTAAGALC